MDRRSWLWRRKSLEKSPSGETESSGSVSSHSERFSDDQTLSNLNTQSPEVTSKAAPGDEQELSTSLKALSEKLSAALLNIRAKEELVNQHAKVAEEAVSGWEKAENEVSGLKKQNDALNQKNLMLEERVGHLDGALKECLRQLRQAREEQEEKIFDAIAKKSNEWEVKKTELENQLAGLHNQLQEAKAEASNTIVADALSRLEAAEKENSIMKLKLLSKADELELVTNERDLSIRAAETASKQHLDSIKKAAKLEAECCRLKAVARKAAASSDYRSTAASSAYAESLPDSQLESGERALVVENDSFKMSTLETPDFGQRKPERTSEKGSMASSLGIDLMHDFLEMERLAALPEMENGGSPSKERPSQDEMEVLINRMAEMEDDLKKVTTERVNLEIALEECRMQLQASQLEVADLKMLLVQVNEAKHNAEEEAKSMKVELETSTHRLDEAKANLILVREELAKANEAKTMVKMELEDANRRKEKAESQLKETELELDRLQLSIGALKKEVEKERNSSLEAVAKCDKLEAELTRMKSDYHSQRSRILDEFRINQDQELAVAASKFAQCQETIASLGRQLKSLTELDDFLIASHEPGIEMGSC